MTVFNIANALKHLPNNQLALAQMTLQAINAAVAASLGRENITVEASFDLLEGKVSVGNIPVKVSLPEAEAVDLVRSALLSNKVIFKPDTKRPKKVIVGRVAFDDVLLLEIRWNRRIRITVISGAMIKVGVPKKRDVGAT
jgi:hypothetical protein